VRRLGNEIIPKLFPQWKKNHYYWAADMFVRCSMPYNLKPEMATDEIQHIYKTEEDIAGAFFISKSYFLSSFTRLPNNLLPDP
jgi:hypothetical protein